MIQTRSFRRFAVSLALASGLTSCLLSEEPLDEPLDQQRQPYEVYAPPIPSYWVQGLPAKDLGPAGPTEFCALTGLGGRFRGAGEEVRVMRAPVKGQPGKYQWYLGGDSQQTGVWAYATCMRHVDGYTGETLWSQGEAAKDLGPTNNRVCFLTRVRGHFEGDGEEVRIRATNGRWVLDGNSQQLGVRAGARCVYASPELILAQEQWAHNGGSGHASRDTPAWRVAGQDSDYCALVHVRGRLSSSDDNASVIGALSTPLRPWWVLAKGDGPVGAGARCLFAKIIIR